MRRLLLLALVVSGCASAGGGGNNPQQDGNPGTDGSDPGDGGPDIDAPPLIDAAVSVTLTQTTSSTNTASNSVTCPNGENSWYRVFSLADHGITGPFFINQVTFGAQEAGGSPVLQIKVGTYTGALGGTTIDLSKVTNLNSATMTIPNTNDPGNNVVVPITATAPAGSNVIVEIFNPSNTSTKFFFIGASNAGETKPGYVRGPSCNDSGGTPITTPRSTASIGFPASNLNINLTGTH
ncbi:MAG TPA: hypothetical protein VFQ53_22300 [Kofleriaceae bacterium]|nr:hypothetical protein [Kofleriaceae bacterium]